MPKRRHTNNSEDDIEYYRRKIRKLKKEKKRKRQRILIESSTESDDNASHTSDTPVQNQDLGTIEPHETPCDITPAAAIDTLPPDPDTEVEAYPVLNEDILVALGEETGSIPKFGEGIHRNLADRWEPILKKGLQKEAKENLLKEYLVPDNCTLLQAPRLNDEVAAAISETARQRDKRKETEQQQLGTGLSAINKALSLMLTDDNKIEAIRIISDGCRILNDLHYQQTQARISVINYSLAKPFLNVVQDCERDETLYGTKLSEKIKATKAIEKQGLSIKKFVRPPRATALTEQTAAPIARPQYQPRQSGSYQGNWSGPSRFLQNRGGRRGPSRPYQPTYRRPPAQPAASAIPANRQKAPPARRQ